LASRTEQLARIELFANRVAQFRRIRLSLAHAFLQQEVEIDLGVEFLARWCGGRGRRGRGGALGGRGFGVLRMCNRKAGQPGNGGNGECFSNHL
jgi:hypothetical protein